MRTGRYDRDVATEAVRRTGRPPSYVDGQSVPERLVDVARQLFAEKGFEGTSVQDVVAAAGVTKGAMYHYFGSKDDLLYEIYGRVLRMQMERLEKFAAEESPVEERLRAAASDVVVTTIENLQSTTIFFRSLHQLGEEKQKEVRRERRRYHEHLLRDDRRGSGDRRLPGRRRRGPRRRLLLRLGAPPADVVAASRKVVRDRGGARVRGPVPRRSPPALSAQPSAGSGRRAPTMRRARSA